MHKSNRGYRASRNGGRLPSHSTEHCLRSFFSFLFFSCLVFPHSRSPTPFLFFFFCAVSFVCFPYHYLSFLFLDRFRLFLSVCVCVCVCACVCVCVCGRAIAFSQTERASSDTECGGSSCPHSVNTEPSLCDPCLFIDLSLRAPFLLELMLFFFVSLLWESARAPSLFSLFYTLGWFLSHPPLPPSPLPSSPSSPSRIMKSFSPALSAPLSPSLLLWRTVGLHERGMAVPQ